MQRSILLALPLVPPALCALGAVLGLGRRRSAKRTAGQSPPVAAPAAPSAAPAATSASAAPAATPTTTSGAPASVASTVAAPTADNQATATTAAAEAPDTGSTEAPASTASTVAAPTATPTATPALPTASALACLAVAGATEAPKPEEFFSTCQAPPAGPCVHLRADCTTPDPAATDVGGRWVHEEELGEGLLLGQGAFGQVAVYTVRGLGEVAVKLERGRYRGAEPYTGPGSVGGEAATLLRLGPSPFLVQLLGRVHRGTGGCTGIIMAPADNSLEGLIASSYMDLFLADACDLLRDVAGGLAFMHAANVAHLDLKAGNVLVDEADGEIHALVQPRVRARICDLGLACSGAALPTLDTSDGWGTPLTMAPEVMLGRACLKSDVFSWGILASWLLLGEPTGDCLYGRRTSEGVRAAVMAGVRPQLPPGCPPLLADLINRAVRLDPLARPSAGEIHRQLAAFRVQHAERLAKHKLRGLWRRP